ncbi:hypothetical protein QE369_000294 [Agrobacterium larrymoorei]|uniref:Uncharacterized protein n=1 Tax=Agrobacterium larrymoorei TaxID=160699 RepID=A0AAJ2BBR7_9HYPH|nr:hypothetical protein [Agrobacterium larrymoorei]MDR6100116.1 hypothetical protein [Agrobacterium larrymoorei]
MRGRCIFFAPLRLQLRTVGDKSYQSHLFPVDEVEPTSSRSIVAFSLAPPTPLQRGRLQFFQSSNHKGFGYDRA